MGSAPRETAVGQEGRQVARENAGLLDGDTFHVMIDGKQDTVRLIGIDTPETVAPRCRFIATARRRAPT